MRRRHNLTSNATSNGSSTHNGATGNEEGRSLKSSLPLNNTRTVHTPASVTQGNTGNLFNNTRSSKGRRRHRYRDNESRQGTRTRNLSGRNMTGRTRGSKKRQNRDIDDMTSRLSSLTLLNMLNRVSNYRRDSQHTSGRNRHHRVSNQSGHKPGTTLNISTLKPARSGIRQSVQRTIGSRMNSSDSRRRHNSMNHDTRRARRSLI